MRQTARADIHMDIQLLARIDAARGEDVSRAAWVRRAIVERLERDVAGRPNKPPRSGVKQK